MAARGCAVIPETETATIVDDSDIAKMYEGYCGPFQCVLAAAKSPLLLALPLPIKTVLASRCVLDKPLTGAATHGSAGKGGGKRVGSYEPGTEE